MSFQEQSLEDRYKQLAEQNCRTMTDTIRMAREADDVGAETLAKLALDREKLLKVDQDLDYINSSLKRCEYHLHSMESWSGAIGNYFRGLPKPENSGTYNATTLPKKAPMCPLSVWRGVFLTEKKVEAALQEGKVHSFQAGEHVMYLVSNAGARVSTSRAIKDCVVVTNLGAFQVKGGVRVGGKGGGFPLRAVESAYMIKGTFLAHDVIHVKSWAGNGIAELSFWNRAATEFMLFVLNEIPHNSRKWQDRQNRPSTYDHTTTTATDRKSRTTATTSTTSTTTHRLPGESEIQRLVLNRLTYVNHNDSSFIPNSTTSSM